MQGKKLDRLIPFLVVFVLGLSACVSRRPKPEVVPAKVTPADTLPNMVDSLRSATDSLPDSLGKSVPDSLPPDSNLADSAKTLAPISVQDSLDTTHSSSGVIDGFDDIVEYKAQDSMVLLGNSLVYLFGPSTVDYKEQGLEANFMRLNTDSNLVFAHYVLDSLGRPTAHPKFKDGSESYEAKSMNYNFKTNKGFITGVVTQQGEGYVTAERTKKVDEQCMYMEGGKYTTCDNHDHPHFYLNLTRAKVRNGKNIVAGPSYLVLLGVPLPIGLPFGFFPFTSKYSSGILMPSYGEESTRGLYLRNGGYYFAINDYVDFQVTGDWYSRGSWGVNAQSRYRKRYGFSGNFNLSYLVTKQGDKDVAGDYSSSKDFRINWTHTQDDKANPSQQFSASVNFSTSSYNHNSLSTLYNPMVSGQNTKSSSINYSKTFTGTPFRLSASIDATQNSADSSVTMSLPNLSVSMNRIFPFKRSHRVGSERWYEKISLSYSGQLRNSISTKESKLFKSSLLKDWQNGISHSIPISASYKLFDYIDFTFSANYNERWYTSRRYQHYNDSTGRVERDPEPVYGFNRSYDFSTSASLSTTLYGFFQPWKIFGEKVQMIRHRITPRIGISYTPDFGEERWGTWKRLRYTDKFGQAQETYYSLYEGQIFGYAGRGKSASINLSLDNNIEAKIRTKGDTTQTFKKISLIDNFSVSTSYNLAADSFQLSDISARLNLKLLKGFNLNLSGSFDPYMYGHTTNSDGSVSPHRVNKLRLLHGKGFGSLRSTGTSFSYTFSNDTFRKLKEFFTGKSDPNKKDKEKGEGDEASSPEGDTSMGAMAAQGQSPQGSGSLYGNNDDTGEYDALGYLRTSMPWTLSVSYGLTYGRSTFDPQRDEYNYRLTHSLMLSGSLQPTKNWSFNFNASYDFEQKKLANLTLGISRDLHCWSLTASAIPFGPYKSYNLTIGVKSSLLRDLKWDKHSYPEASTWY